MFNCSFKVYLGFCQTYVIEFLSRNSECLFVINHFLKNSRLSDIFSRILNTPRQCNTCRWIRSYFANRRIGVQTNILKIPALEIFEKTKENLLGQHLDLIQSFIRYILIKYLFYSKTFQMNALFILEFTTLVTAIPITLVVVVLIILLIVVKCR